MLTSTVISAIVLATGAMAQNYGGGYGYSSAIPMSSATPTPSPAPESWEAWVSSSTPMSSSTESWAVWTSSTKSTTSSTSTPTSWAVWTSSTKSTSSTPTSWAIWTSSSSLNSSVKTVTASTSSTWPTSSAHPSSLLVQVVQVSTFNGSSLKYYPEKIQAPPGSWVQFQFYPKNHTVTQSTFNNPCVPIHDIMPNVTGINSGFMPVASNATEIPVFSVLINDTTPIWMYCAQVGHCEAGMSMVINEAAGSNKTLEAYQAAAALIGVSNSTTTKASSSIMMMPTTVPTIVPTITKASPSTFTGAANRQVVGSSGLAGLLGAAIAFVL